MAVAPARAGGLGGLLSPAMGNGCAARDEGTSARGATAASQGSTAGNRLGVPFAGPTNQCGGADLPVGFVQGGVGRNVLNIDLFGDQT
ncbi:chaplin family protein [Streptomyces sp. CA-181903]|uniref:chaplin family protein n=1 Tax=Streptomyces sp. CA-181903 TaxID=3240055 RepID=UPI003D8F1674